MKNKLSVRINTTAQTSGGSKRLAAYTLLSSAASDVDSKKHKKNPFDSRYVQLCLSDFAQVTTVVQQSCSSVHIQQQTSVGAAAGAGFKEAGQTQVGHRRRCRKSARPCGGKQHLAASSPKTYTSGQYDSIFA